MTVEQITEFKTRVRDALENGAKHNELREIVLRSYEDGGTKDEAYETLQQIWLEYGYDDDPHDDPDPKRDELEYMMERVWYWGS